MFGGVAGLDTYAMSAMSPEPGRGRHTPDSARARFMQDTEQPHQTQAQQLSQGDTDAPAVTPR